MAWNPDRQAPHYKLGHWREGKVLVQNPIQDGPTEVGNIHSNPQIQVPKKRAMSN